MGHQHLQDPPRTEEWRKIIKQFKTGANPEELTKLTLRTCETEIRGAVNDIGLVRCVYFLLNIPYAAKDLQFAQKLRDLGIQIENEPTLLQVIGAIQATLDQVIQRGQKKNDLDEMAQLSLVEALVEFVGTDLDTQIFDADAESVRLAFARLSKDKPFSQIVRAFFSRFVFRALDYFLSRALMSQIQQHGRFVSLDDERQFTDHMNKHCQKCARVLEVFSPNWRRKIIRETQDKQVEPKGPDRKNWVEFSEEQAGTFLFGALHKLIFVIKKGGYRNG
jgi:hypothetical protein